MRGLLLLGVLAGLAACSAADADNDHAAPVAEEDTTVPLGILEGEPAPGQMRLVAVLPPSVLRAVR